MSEGKQVLAGEAILSGVAPIERTETSAARTMCSKRWSGSIHGWSTASPMPCCARHHDAEDATQETFMRVLRYSSKLAAVENQKTWLARIAWRVAVDRSRQRRRTQEIPLEDPEKPIAEVASSDAPADETVQGAQVGIAAGADHGGAPGQAARALDFVDSRRDVAT